MTGSSLTIEIVLADGRSILATPLPEDQELLQSWGDRDVTLTDNADDSDTTGHKIAATPDITLDVEGHAMTLRLPNTADVDTLKKALAVGAVSATIVAAGAIAAMQGPQTAAPAIPEAIHPVPITGQAPVPRAEFQVRQEQRADEMLAAPVPISQPSDVTTEDVSRISPSTGGATSAAAAGSAAATAPSAPFEERKERHADDLLAAPAPLPIPDGDVEN